jgi:hypothetical protein
VLFCAVLFCAVLCCREAWQHDPAAVKPRVICAHPLQATRENGWCGAYCCTLPMV